MKLKRFNVNQHYHFTYEDIADCVEKIDTLPDEVFSNRKDKIAIRIRIEEALLNFREHFGESQSFDLHIHKVFGKYHLQIVVNGDFFNPLDTEDEQSSVSNQFLQVMSVYGSELTHQYHSGSNRLVMSFGKKAKISGMALLAIAILGGILCGWLGSYMPESIRTYPTVVFETLQSIIMGLITFAALPMVFLCVIEGITACGSIQNLGQRGIKTIKSFFEVGFIVMILCFAACCVLFPLNWQLGGDSGGIFEMIVSVFSSIFPTNLLQPFVEGNMLQVVLIGIVLGCSILIIGEKSHGFLSLINSLSANFSVIMQWFCNLIPFALFCMITTNIWKGTFSDSLNTWPVIVVIVVISIILLILTALITAKMTKTSFSKTVKAVIIPTIYGLSTGSSVSAFPSMKNVLVSKFSVEEDYASFALPMGITFFGLGALVMYTVVLIFMAHLSGVAVSAGWVISALLLIFIFSVASPPVAGGAIAVITLLFTTQGIGETWFAGAFVCIMLMDYVVTALRVGMLTMVCACQAEKLGQRNDSFNE